MVNAIGIFAEPNTNRVLTNKVAFYGPRAFQAIPAGNATPRNSFWHQVFTAVNPTTGKVCLMVPLWETRFGEPAMAITDIPIPSMLRTRADWAPVAPAGSGRKRREFRHTEIPCA